MGALVYTLTPNCYKVSFDYHPVLVKCIKRIPSARYRADGKFWEVDTFDVEYLRLMADWAKKYHLCNGVSWLKDEEPIESYDIPEMPELDVPHNMKMEPYPYQAQGIAYALEK